MKMKEFLNLKEVFRYLVLGKRKGSYKGDFTTPAMHIINRIAIIVFLMGIVILVIRNV